MFDSLRLEVDNIISDSDKSVNQRLLSICQLLEKHIGHYDWVGFYFRNGDKRELILGPYVGEATDHKIIPFGKGICGQVALTNKNFLVSDVSEQDNYLACSMHVKSEIVIPIFVNNKNIGQIDIDSHTANAFTANDENFLEYVCQQVAKILE